jgi:glucose-6-phosphate isomerase
MSHINSLEKTAWIFISKSGNTIEVLALINFLNQFLEEKNINLWKSSFYITEQKNNPLYNLAQKHERPCLEIPVDVGGRFSFLSPAGMLIARLCGLNIESIKQGAILALKDEEAVLKITEQYLSSFEDHKNISLFWFYNSSMRWFGGWLQQLWAESLGKKMTRQNAVANPFSTPMIAIGSSDQHSILQQVMDGEKNKFITFFRFNHIEKYNYTLNRSYFDETTPLLNKKFGTLIEAQAQGTAEALLDNGIPQLTLEIEKLDEKNLGYLFMYFQIIVSLIGEYHDINAFDQPGVQAGKNKTLEKLQSQRF